MEVQAAQLKVQVYGLPSSLALRLVIFTRHAICIRANSMAVGYISRSVAGSYDNEAIAIFILIFTFYLWLRAVKEGSALYACFTALFYFYMVGAWGS